MPPPPETPAPVPGHEAPASPPAADAQARTDAVLAARLRRRRVWVGAASAAGLVVALWMALPSDAGTAAADASPDDEAAMARAQWAAMKRRAPVPLGRAGVRDTLGPGDAEHADGRYADYYVYTARDSAAFSVVVASAGFAPDLDVRRPDGATVAASALLRTGARAEVAGLRGPGRFEIAVTSREPGATGAYELSAGPAPVADTLYADEPARGDTLGGPGSAVRVGRFERVYGVVAGSDAPVVVRVVSPDFVPRLALLGPTGEVEGTWQSVERVAGDSLSGVVLRYLPGWDVPYRLVVTSESPRARGTFAVDVRTLPTRALQANGRPVGGRLGDDSWLDGYRYIDTYRFTVRDGMRTTIEAASREIPPALRLFRQDRREDRETAAEPNARGNMAARIEQTLPAGEYVLEVTSGGTPADTTRAEGGAYSLVVRQTPLAPPPAARRPAPARPPAEPAESLRSRVFGVSGERTGTSGGSTFAVGATQIALSYPGGRTRVQISVSVRSVDYTGAWAAWSSFARKSYVVDDDGRRYTSAPGEAVSPSGGQAEPGTVRRGTVVFYASSALAGQRRFTLVASVGESSVTLPLSVP